MRLLTRILVLLLPIMLSAQGASRAAPAKSSDKPAAKSSEKSAAKPSEKSPAKTSEKPAAKPAEKSAKAPEKAKPSEKTEKTAEKPAAKPAKAPDKPTAKAAPKPAAKPEPKPVEHAEHPPAAPVAASPVVSAKAAAAALAETERAAIQSDLIWSGDYQPGATESPERVTAAVKAFQKRNGGRETGSLTADERAKLAQAAKQRQDQTGWRVIDDPATGARLAIPQKLTPQSAAAKSGSRWQSGHGEVQVETFRVAAPGTTLASVFAQQKGEPAERKVEYNQMRPDSFVISGLQGLKKFQVRGQAKDGEVRGIAVLYDQALEGTMDRVAAAISTTFAGFPGRAGGGAGAARRKVEYGTGFIVSPAGDIVTDSNLLAGCELIVVQGLGPAERVAEDGAASLALVRLNGVHDFAPVGLVNPPKPVVEVAPVEATPPAPAATAADPAPAGSAPPPADAAPASGLAPRADAAPASGLAPRADAAPGGDGAPGADVKPPADAAAAADAALRGDAAKGNDAAPGGDVTASTDTPARAEAVPASPAPATGAASGGNSAPAAAAAAAPVVNVAPARNVMPSNELTLVGIADPQAQSGGKAVSTARGRLLAANGIEPAPGAGFAGAVAINGEGDLTGMVGLRQAANGAVQAAMVPAQTIVNFLDTQNIPPLTGSGSIDDVKAAAVRLICVRN